MNNPPQEITWLCFLLRTRWWLSRDEALLAFSCIDDLAKRQRYWDEWLGRQKEPVATLGSIAHRYRRCLGYFHHKVDEAKVALPSDVLTMLRTASVREQARSATYWQYAATIFSALEAAGIEFLTIRGGALSHWAYPEPWMRHSHDLDLLIATENLAGTHQILQELGLMQRGNVFVHTSQMEFVIHATDADSFREAFASRETIVRKEGTKVLLPSASWCLTHLLATDFRVRLPRSPYPLFDAFGLWARASEADRRAAVPFFVRHFSRWRRKWRR